MQLGMIGLGRMGANMVRRLMRSGHTCVVYDHSPAAIDALEKEGAQAAHSPESLIDQLTPPRAVWLMVPAAVVDATLDELLATRRLEAGDALIDGGNSHYVDDIRRSAELKDAKLEYLDVGTSGGIHGLERGYCLMIGGSAPVVQRLDPIFRALAPGSDGSTTSGASTAELGYLHCGPGGAGHFVKMVHNAIEYGLMESYAEGLNILKHADVGTTERAVDAETTPLRNPEYYQYDFNVAAVAEVWRHGRSAPAPVLSAALFQRFSSRGEALFAEKVLSAMRFQFGGHVERFVGD